MSFFMHFADLAFQLNDGKFEYNGRCGYVVSNFCYQLKFTPHNYNLIVKIFQAKLHDLIFFLTKIYVEELGALDVFLMCCILDTFLSQK